jgi:hypothetical protein
MRENLMSGSMWQGMGNLDMAMVLRHSQKKWRETGLPCLRFWHHPLTLPWVHGIFLATTIGHRKSNVSAFKRANVQTAPICSANLPKK